MKNKLTEDKQKIENELYLVKIRQDFDIEYARQKIDLDKLHDEKTLLKYQIDSTERIYNRLGIKEIKINQFTGDSKNNLASVLPQMGYALGQMSTANQ